MKQASGSPPRACRGASSRPHCSRPSGPGWPKQRGPARRSCATGRRRRAGRQRSCIVVPIGAGRSRFGFLYADVDGGRGRFAPADLDRLVGLARRAAARLADARRHAALTHKLEAQGGELARLLKETERRNAELAVINGIQQAVSAALDFQGIVDVVGDKLREVFATGDMSICWWDEASQRVQSLYGYEQAYGCPYRPARSSPAAAAPLLPGEEAGGRSARSRSSWRVGVPLRPGTDRARSMLIVPMLAGERMLGRFTSRTTSAITRSAAAEQRLLETIAASMSVALENARLFDRDAAAAEGDRAAQRRARR